MEIIKNTKALGYIQGLLSRVSRANCVSIAERIGISHDGITRTISSKLFQVEALIKVFFLQLFGSKPGSLIIDDTTINKEFAKMIEGCSWVWSSAHEKILFGYSLVLICWSDGENIVPLAWRIYDKANGKTKIDLAVELLVHVKLWLNCKPELVLFDAFYTADKVIKKCEESDWKYLARVRRNRSLNGKQIQKLRKNPYWEETGNLSSGEKARIVREGKRYFITNEFEKTRKEIVNLYKNRWPIEEVFRLLHSEIGIDECESRTLIAQENHFALCMLAHYVLESEKTRTGNSWYAIRHHCKLDPQLAQNLVVATFKEDA